MLLTLLKSLLGLSTIDSAIRRLGKRSAKTTVIGKFYSDMDMDGDAKAQDALNKIQTAEEKRNIIYEQLDENASQIKHYEGRKEQLYDILRDNQTTASLQKKKEELESIILEDQRALEDTSRSYFKEFSYGSLAFFAQPLISKTKVFLKEVKVDDKGIRDLTKPTIMELIKRGRCICGNEVFEGNDAYKHLMEELAYVPPESIGNTVRHYREKINSFSKPAERTFESLTERYESILRLKTRIQERKDEVSEISEQIKGKENMRQYEAEVMDVKTRIKNLMREKCC